MSNIDWEKWMKDHHIKLGGNPDDNRKNAIKSGGGVQVGQLETKGTTDAGRPSDSDIFHNEKERIQVRISTKAKRARNQASSTDKHV